MNKTPALFNLHEIDKKYPHLFDPGEVPKSLFLAVNQHVESEDGVWDDLVMVDVLIHGGRWWVIEDEVEVLDE